MDNKRQIWLSPERKRTTRERFESSRRSTDPKVAPSHTSASGVRVIPARACGREISVSSDRPGGGGVEKK